MFTKGKVVILTVLLLVFVMSFFACGNSSSAWDNGDVTINFYVDGEITESLSYWEDGCIPPVAPIFEDREFCGWFFDEEYTLKYDEGRIFDYAADGIVNVYAKYTDNETDEETNNGAGEDDNGATGGETDEGTGDETDGETGDEPDGEGGDDTDGSDTEDSDYYVVFYLNGDIYHTSEIDDNGIFSMPDNPYIAGYTFDGWFTDEMFEEPFVPYDIIGEDIKSSLYVYAKMVGNESTVSYYVDEDKYYTMTVTYGEELHLPDIPYKDGYTFLYWEDSRTGEEFDVTAYSSMPEREDVDVRAVFLKEDVTVTLMLGGEIYDVITLGVNDKLSLPTLPDRLGYKFDGWHSGGELFNVDEYNEDKDRKSVVLNAEYRELITIVTTVLFDGTTKQYIVDGTLELDIMTPPDVSGYTFVRWYYLDDNVDRVTFDQEAYLAEINREDITIYAEYDNLVTYIDLCIDGEVAERIEVNGVDDVVLPVPMKEGYEFIGWYKDSEYQEEFSYEEYVNSSSRKDITLYAKFESLKTEIVFVVNGEEYYRIIVDFGIIIDVPEDPCCDGFVFGGWFIDESMQEEFDENTLMEISYTEILFVFAEMIEDEEGNLIIGNAAFINKTVIALIEKSLGKNATVVGYHGYEWTKIGKVHRVEVIIMRRAKRNISKAKDIIQYAQSSAWSDFG